MLKIIKAGIYTSVQDMGRVKYGQYGVPISGAMDRFSASLANQIVNNIKENALLEITLGNVELLFEKQTVIAVTGANVEFFLNEKSAAMNCLFNINANTRLSLKKTNFGLRSYLAVKGGFLSEKIMNSRSFFKGLTKAQRLNKGDTIAYKGYVSSGSQTNSSIKAPLSHFNTQVIEVLQGPEFEALNSQQANLIEQINFSISNDNNRMAYRLNENIENKLEGLLTSAVMPGTVQLTPSGQLIILMRDCQVTGGYPRILQLTNKAINQMAQKSTGDQFKFQILKNQSHLN